MTERANHERAFFNFSCSRYHCDSLYSRCLVEILRTWRETAWPASTCATSSDVTVSPGTLPTLCGTSAVAYSPSARPGPPPTPLPRPRAAEVWRERYGDVRAASRDPTICRTCRGSAATVPDEITLPANCLHSRASTRVRNVVFIEKTCFHFHKSSGAVCIASDLQLIGRGFESWPVSYTHLTLPTNREV